MNKIAILLRLLQFYSHIAHNLSSGETFFQDHEFFGGLYPEYEKAYDSVVERMIGLGEKVDLFKIQSQAVEMLSKIKFTNNKQAIQELLKLEKALVSTIDKFVVPTPMSHPHSTISQGTSQLAGDLADRSESRQYMMNQRIAPVS